MWPSSNYFGHLLVTIDLMSIRGMELGSLIFFFRLNVVLFACTTVVKKFETFETFLLHFAVHCRKVFLFHNFLTRGHST